MDGNTALTSTIRNGNKLLELQTPKAPCGKTTATSFTNAYELHYGSPYPTEQPSGGVPHNILRFFKKPFKHLIPKLFALTHLDVVLREILLATISLDGPGREKLVQELEVLAHKLEEPLDKLVGSFGKSMKAVLQAIPGLNIVYAISDISEVIKQGNDAAGEATGSLTEFIDKVDKVYKRSAGSNRLVSSMMYAMMDFLNDKGSPEMKNAAEKRVGKRVAGPAGGIPIDPDVTSATVSRAFSNEALRKGLLQLLASTKDIEDIKTDADAKKLVEQLKDSITSDGTSRSDVSAGIKQEVNGVKGLGELNLLNTTYNSLRDKYDKRKND